VSVKTKAMHCFEKIPVILTLFELALRVTGFLPHLLEN